MKKCGNAECSTSTGVCGTITHGWGELDPNGYWEHECKKCTQGEVFEAEWHVNLWITCAGCGNDYDYLSSDHYNEGGWEALPDHIGEAGSFVAECDCGYKQQVKIVQGIV